MVWPTALRDDDVGLRVLLGLGLRRGLGFLPVINLVGILGVRCVGLRRGSGRFLRVGLVSAESVVFVDAGFEFTDADLAFDEFVGQSFDRRFQFSDARFEFLDSVAAHIRNPAIVDTYTYVRHWQSE